MKIHGPPTISSRTAFRKNIVQPLTGLAVTILLFTLFFPLYGRTSIDTEDAFSFFCLPNGEALAPRVLRFQLHGETRDYFMNWSTKQWLRPTMSWGHLNFAEAKVIDVCWDFLVGRCGQFALALYMYPVLKRVMLHRLETNGVPLSVYSSLTIDRLSPFFLWTLFVRQLREKTSTHTCERKHGTKSSVFGAWTFLAWFYIIAYILMFQTVLSIAASYQVRLTPAIGDPDGVRGLSNVDNLHIPALVLRDGSRLGLADDMPLCYPEAGRDADDLGELFYDYATSYLSIARSAEQEEGDMPHILRGNVPNASWTLYLPNTTSTTYHTNLTIDGRHHSLGASPLTIDAISTPSNHDLPIFKTALESWTISSSTLQYYSLNSTLLPFSAVEDLADCIPSAHYEWGLSFLMLFTFFFFTVVFVCILAKLRYAMHWHSRVDVIRPEESTYRDILDLAAELRANLGEEVEGMTVKGIEEAASGREIVVTMEVEELPAARRRRKQTSDADSDESVRRESVGVDAEKGMLDRV